MQANAPLRAIVMGGVVFCTAALSSVAASAQSTDVAPAPIIVPVTPTSPLIANVMLANQYRCRDLMQTNNKPAIQGGVDYALPSGFYVGNWNSPISWLGDSSLNVSAPIEMDLYDGYKTGLTKDVPIDAGMLQYCYPDSYPDGYIRPHITEGYTQISYGPVTFKYSHTFFNLSGFADSHHSRYFDLSGNFDTGFWGLTLNLCVGYQQVPYQVVRTSYADWRVGVTKDLGSGWTVFLSYIGMNASRLTYTNTRNSYMGKATVLLIVTKAF